MSFYVTCSECDEELKVRDAREGTKIKCPECGSRFTARSEKSDRPRRRERGRDAAPISAPVLPIIWGVLAILLPCGPVGLAIAALAIFRSSAALAELPESKRAAGARMMMKITMTLGIIGAIISIVLTIVSVTLTLRGR